MDYAQSLVEAIGQTRIMVLIFSSHSNYSPHVRRELELAVSAGVPILPFRTEDVPLSPSLRYFIGTVHWLDALTPPLEKHLGHLAETVKLLLRITKPEQVAAEVEAPQPAGAVETAIEKGRYKPAPLSGASAAAKRWAGRPVVALAAACGTAKRWAGRPVVAVAAASETARRWATRPRVRLAAVVGIVVVAEVVTAIFVVAGLPFCGGNGGAGRSVPTFRGNPARTGVNPGPGVERSPKQFWRFETGGNVLSSPAVVERVVYIGSDDSYVYALDAATGAERWRFHFQTGGNVLSSPAVVGGVLYIGSDDNYVYALDAATGAERWRFQTGGLVHSSPAVVGGVLYIGSDDSYAYALDAATGEQRWRFKTGGDVFSAPAVLDGVVYVGSYDNYVYALDAATGEQRWRFETGAHLESSPAVANGAVYVGSNDDYVYALDAATGEKRWRFQTGAYVLSSPAVANGIMYVGSGDGYVYALDAATGAERWRFQTGGLVHSSPALVEGVVYIGSRDSHVYAITEDHSPTTATAPAEESATPTASPMPSPTPAPTAAAAGGRPTAFLETFHAAEEASIETDTGNIDIAIGGDFEAPGSCSCDTRASVADVTLLKEGVILMGDKAWIDTGDGWSETTPSEPEMVDALGLCPACPSFWEDLSFEALTLPGEHDTKNSVPAIHYTLADIPEAFTGIQLIPEEWGEGVSIETADLWLAEDGGWPVCISLRFSAEGQAAERAIPLLEGVEWTSIAWTIDITQVNDPSIRVNAP
jgi:outer membrane protein assembly factor BamB